MGKNSRGTLCCPGTFPGFMKLSASFNSRKVVGVTSTIGQGVRGSKEVFRRGGMVVEESLGVSFFQRFRMDSGSVWMVAPCNSLRSCHR